MWATIKNYAIVPSKGGGGRNGGNPVMDELPFSASFTVNDRQQLLKMSSKSQTSKAARQKLMLALTEDPDCFAYLQSKLRERNVCTHQTVGELLRNDSVMLEELSSRVMDNGVTLSKQQQLQHGIISSKIAAAHSNLNGDGGMNLLNNLRGLVIQQDEICEDEPAYPYGYSSSTTRMTAPSYVVVSTPHQQNNQSYHHNHNTSIHGNGNGRGGIIGKRGSLTKYLSSRDKRGSSESISTGVGFVGKQRGGGARRSVTTATTPRSSVSSTYSARDSLVSSASEWFSTALPARGLRQSSSEPVSMVAGANAYSPQPPTRAIARLSTGDASSSSSWFQVNMSSHQMSESLQTSLRYATMGNINNSSNVNADDDITGKVDVNEYTGSCHVVSSNALAADDYSSEPGGEIMLTLAQRRQMKMTRTSVAEIDTHLNQEKDRDDQSVLLVGFPTKKQGTDVRWRRSKQTNMLFSSQAAQAEEQAQ
jgi:hypothetical protein